MRGADSRRIRGPRGSGNGPRHRSRGRSRSSDARGAGRAGIGARECALGSVTLQRLSLAHPLTRSTRGRANGSGRRSAIDTSERTRPQGRDARARTRKAPRAHPKPATVHAAWWRKPRLSGTTWGSSQDDLRADAGGRNRALPGSPRSDEVSEVRRTVRSEKTTLRGSERLAEVDGST
jgi:hypothetical protein